MAAPKARFSHLSSAGALPLVHPLTVFVVPSIVAIGLWFFTPQDWFRDFLVLQKVEARYVLTPWGMAFACFCAGSMLRRFISRGRSARKLLHPPGALVAFQWVTFGLAVVSFFILVGITTAKSGLAGLLDQYSIKESYLGGVTSFTLLTSASLTIAGSELAVGKPLGQLRSVPIIGMLLLASHRAIFGGERLAILIPLTAFAVTYLIVRGRASLRRILLVGFFGIVFVVSIFVGLEYYRSYTAKLKTSEDILTNPVAYGLKRLNMYYALSVNSGASEIYEAHDNAIRRPLFTTTCNPIAKVIYGLGSPGARPFGEGYSDLTTIIAFDGFYNPEFTNIWGVSAPFTEGFMSASIYWLFWGWVGTHLYIRVKSNPNDIWYLTLYGLFIAALIDTQSRVGLLGGIHFLAPFVWVWMARNVVALRWRSEGI